MTFREIYKQPCEPIKPLRGADFAPWLLFRPAIRLTRLLDGLQSTKLIRYFGSRSALARFEGHMTGMDDKKNRADDPRDPRQDQRYLSMLIALMAVVILSALTAIAGDMVFENETIRQTGFSIAMLGGVAYFSLRIYGNVKGREYERERRRRELARGFDDDRSNPDDDDDEEEHQRRERETRA